MFAIFLMNTGYFYLFRPIKILKMKQYMKENLTCDEGS